MARKSFRLEQVENDYLAALYRKEKAATYEMAIRYRQAVKALTPLWRDAYAKLQAAKAAGYADDYLSGFIWSEYRLARLLDQAASLFSAMAADNGLLLSSLQRDSVALAQQGAQAQILASLQGGSIPQVNAGFVSFPEAQLQTLTGRLQDGSPIDEWSRRYGQQGANVVKNSLVAGVVNGESPAIVASRLSKALGTDYGQMALMTRTEMLRVYRDTTQQVYDKNKHLVKGWRWSSARQDSTCPMCWAMDGQVFPTREKMATHPACRCSMTPITRPWSEIHPALAGVPEIKPPDIGIVAFARLPNVRKQAILGPQGFKAYQARMLRLQDYPKLTFSDKWGTGRQQRSLVSMIGPDNMAKLRGTKPGPLRVPAPKAIPKPKTQPLPTTQLRLPGTAQPVPTIAKALRPTGSPIKDQLDFSGLPARGESGALVDKLRHTQGLIDGVHGDGTLERVSIELGQAKKTNGSYSFFRQGSQLKPSHITSSRNGSTPHLTFAHEIGHYLDQQLLWPKFMNLSYSQGGASETLIDYVRMGRWEQAVKQSRAYERMRELKQHARARVKYKAVDPATGREFEFLPNERYLDYAMQNDELWARSYAQYIAIRSKDPGMLRELNEARDPIIQNIYHVKQWADDDFEPIAEAIDELFQGLGLLA